MAELASRYQLVRRLGEGGMGVVHEAFDRVLGRHVAIKMIRGAAADAPARERFFREARSAAAISHPNVCHLHEVGEDEGQPFLVMELLEGEPLADRLVRGPLPLTPALEIVLPVLSALSALHSRGIVHRDLKPSNIFLTPHGVKLLDFGLARQTERETADTMSALTMPGTFSGTPRYMAPEQITGDPVDARADLFAAGIVLYELVTGRLPFDARSTVDMLSAVLKADPAPLGRPELAPLEPLMSRALQRRPDDRFPSADAMAAALRPLLRGTSTYLVTLPAFVPPAARLVVLPFQMLRADDEVGFLERALPEAITTSLAAVPSLCVRSNITVLRFEASADLAQLSRELDVDHLLTGSLLRAGDRIRVTAQLVEMPGGRVRWSQTTERPLGDLFELQDGIARSIVDALPLDGRAMASTPGDLPATPHVYELYLRANELSREAATWLEAKRLYEQCVDEDPRFAPAWARLGRVLRITGKYLEKDHRPSFAAAEAALQRAFALNPDLSLAHHLYVYLEVETGRATEALIRLASRIQREPNQAELYAALCHAARYCGLFEASVAAHHRARELDPQVSTSVVNTYVSMRDLDAAIAAGSDERFLAMVRFESGADPASVLQIIDADAAYFDDDSPSGLFASAERAMVLGDREGVVANCRRLITLSENFPDGEAIYAVTRLLARAGATDLALTGLGATVAAGFFAAAAFERDPWLDTVRDSDAYRRIVAAARERSLAADAAFQASGGYRALRLPPPTPTPGGGSERRPDRARDATPSS